MMTGQSIVKEALTWVGTPYRDNAMTKGVGVDCAHLLMGVAIESGLLDRATCQVVTYPEEWHLHRSEELLVNGMKAYAYEIGYKDLQVGDFLLYQYGRCISHAAIYMGGGRVIHAYVGLGVVISDINDVIFYDKQGKSRLRKVFRYKECD